MDMGIWLIILWLAIWKFDGWALIGARAAIGTNTVYVRDLSSQGTDNTCIKKLKGVGPKYIGVINFWKKKKGGHTIFDNQNVGSHKTTIDSVFILLKKTDFVTILACLEGKVYWWWGVVNFCRQNRGVAIFLTQNFCKFGTPLPKKMPAPLLSAEANNPEVQ